MGHDWKELEIKGTTGWYRCARCGTRLHDAGGPPSVDWQAYGIGGCDQVIDKKSGGAINKIENMLYVLDADTPEIRSLIVQILNSPES